MTVPPFRYCERSEAIHLSAHQVTMGCFAVQQVVRTNATICGTCFDQTRISRSLTRATLAASEVVAKRDCGDAALTKTQALQERRCLGILH
jgi:hypothetical protein